MSTSDKDIKSPFGKVSAKLQEEFQSIKAAPRVIHKEITGQVTRGGQDIHNEFLEFVGMTDVAEGISKNAKDFFYIPFLPGLHRPGWLLRYVLGPYDLNLVEMFFSDFWAGVTVAITLIPQALSYAVLANLPAINGLYTAILPSATYIFLGSSMILAVGPVALVSLIVGQLINIYGITPGSQDSVDFAGEAALAVGTILAVMAILNMGNFIRFISHPVMSAFTSAAACLIGFSQLKNAFGFPGESSGNPNFIGTPQQGQTGYEYQYEVMRWYTYNWQGVYTVYTAPYKCRLYDPPTSKLAANCVEWAPNPNSPYIGNTYINPYAVKISIGLFIPMFIIANIRLIFKPNAERNKSYLFKIWQLLSTFTPLFAIIIGGHLAWKFKNDNPNDFYAQQLKIVGAVAPGLGFLAVPKINYDFLKLLGDVFPLTIVAFMESYSVAHRLATRRNELHILSASQEMFANAAANFMASVSSSYPISGSYSRSSLNEAAGARTPMSKMVTMLTIVVVLGALTDTFFYIPNAALAAVIWGALWNLISVYDFIDAYKHSKKDFLVMLTTFVITFTFNTGIGLGAGVGVSLIVFLADTYLSKLHWPTVTYQKKQISDIVVLRLESDLTFFQAGPFSDSFEDTIRIRNVEPSVDQSCNEKLKFQIYDTLDHVLGKPLTEVSDLPSAVIFDFEMVKIIDLTGLKLTKEAISNARPKGVLCVIINLEPSIAAKFRKFGVKNDQSSSTVDIDKYVELAQGLDFVSESVTKEIELNNTSTHQPLPVNDDETVIYTNPEVIREGKDTTLEEV